MTSEIRANTLKNRVGLGTVSFTNTGAIVSGIVTANSFSGPISGTTGTFSGNVDINGDLDVDGHTNLDNVSIVGVTTHNGQSKFYGNGGAPLIWGDTGYSGHLSFDGSNNAVIRAASGKALIFQTDHVNERLRIDSSGRLLLNTTTTYVSNQMMIVKGASPSAGGNRPYDGQLAIEGSETTGAINTGGVLAFIGHSGTGSRGFGSIRCLKEDGTSGNYGSYMSFETRANGSAPAEKLRITSGGEVLIGTTTGTGNNLTIQDAGTSTTAGGNIVARFQSNGSGRDASIQLSDNVAHSALISMVSSNFAINLSGNERLRIDSNGNMNLGSGATIAGLRYLDVQNNSSAANNHGSILRLITSNAAGNSTTSVDMVKYKDGNFFINNNETSGSTNFNTGGSTRLVITSTGKVLIGSSNHNTLIASGVGSQLQIEGNSYQTSSLALINNSTSTDPAFINFGKSRAGSSGGTTIVQNGDRVGGIRWSVADGTDLHSRVAQIDVFVNGTPGSNDTPGMISIQTTPDGSHIPVDQLNIDSYGRVTIGGGIQNQFASAFNGGADRLVITNNGNAGLTIDATSSTSSSIHFADGSDGNESYRGIIEYKHSEDDMKFAVEAQHVARLRKGSYSDVGGGMIIGNAADVSGSAHSDSRTLILGATNYGETGMTLLNSTSGSGKIRFSDGVQYYNQGAIGYYHGTRTVGLIPNYGESLSFVAAQKENNFVLNGNEAIRVCSDMDRQKMVDGFWSKSINTTFQTVFSIQSGYDNTSPHRGYFYEIIVFGGDWGSHSANRTYFKGFINGYDGYQGHTVIEHSGTYGSNTGGQGHYGSSECQIQVTFTGNGNSHIQMKLTTGSVTAEGYARFIGFIRDYDGFHIR